MANEGNRQHWNQSGQTWVAHQRTFDRMLLAPNFQDASELLGATNGAVISPFALGWTPISADR